MAQMQNVVQNSVQMLMQNAVQILVQSYLHNTVQPSVQNFVQMTGLLLQNVALGLRMYYIVTIIAL